MGKGIGDLDWGLEILGLGFEIWIRIGIGEIGLGIALKNWGLGLEFRIGYLGSRTSTGD